MRLNIMLIILLNCSCISTLKYNENKNFFEFDEVLHYSTDDNSVQANKKMEAFKDLYYGNFPRSLNQDISFSFESDLIKFGYVENIIPSNKNNQINKIFSERRLKNGRTIMCLPKYRDILIFKKDRKITAIVKVCFECEKCQIIGTEKNTMSFYTPKNFRKLHKVLYGKKYKWNE
ncbi:MAG: hypothetical protein WBA59_05600 [Moheibacter sp.]